MGLHSVGSLPQLTHNKNQVCEAQRICPYGGWLSCRKLQTEVLTGIKIAIKLESGARLREISHKNKDLIRLIIVFSRS